MILPLPFTILVALISLGLLIARFIMKNGTRYFISVLALVDVILKCNWIILCVLLAKEDNITSAIIIGYCLFATIITNLIIWRSLYYKYGFDKDSLFLVYLKKFPKISKFLLFVSFTLAFHFFRLTYSRLLGKSAFSAQFKDG